MSFDPVSPRQPLPRSGGFSPLADFAVWVLEKDGLTVPPFDKHTRKAGKLQALGFNQEHWLEWFQFLLDPANAQTDPVAYWDDAPFQAEMQRLQKGYWLRSVLNPKETYPLLYSLDPDYFLGDDGVFYGEYIPGDDPAKTEAAQPWNAYVSRLKYRSDEYLCFDHLCAIAEVTPDDSMLVRRVSKALGKGGICGIRYGS